MNLVAVVLTFRRPVLATEVVRGLLDREGLAASQVLLVVNGEGGLADAELERAVHVRRLPDNAGPAGGFAAGLTVARRDLGADWVYLCEDDVGLLDLPAPRLGRLVEAVEAMSDVGAVVAYGRDLDRRTGATVPHASRGPAPFEDVDVAAWGASLVRGAALDAGVAPDPSLFFGYEDFDFWLRMREHGYRILVDTAAAAAAGGAVSGAGRQAAFHGRRPDDSVEPWRRYYEARNFFHLARDHGNPLWTASHLAKSVRRLQLGPTYAHRASLAAGLRDGLLGRRGRNDHYQRALGEVSS